MTQRVVVDIIAQSLLPFKTLQKFSHGIGYGQRCKITFDKYGDKKAEFAWHWMGSEGRTLLLLLPYVLWNVCGFDIPVSFKNRVIHFNRMIVNIMLQHSLSLLEEHTDSTCAAMDSLHAAWQFEVRVLSEKISGVSTYFPKFHFGCHESSFIVEHGANTLTNQHFEAELGYTAKKSSKRSNMQVDSMALQQDKSRRLVTTLNQHAFIFNEKNERPGFHNPRGPYHAAGPEHVKTTTTDIHIIKSRIDGEKCQKFRSTVFHTLPNLAPHAGKKLALQVNFPDYVYSAEADIGDPAEATLPYNCHVTTTPSSCRIAGSFVRAALVPTRKGNLLRPRPASFVQVFEDNEAEYGKVISIFQVKFDKKGSKPEIFLHVHWLDDINPHIDSVAGTDNRRSYEKNFPRQVQAFYKTNFDNIPRTVLVPFVFRDLTRWDGSNVVKATDVKRVVYMHPFANLPLPANVALRRPQNKDGLLFLNTLVSLPKQLHVSGHRGRSSRLIVVLVLHYGISPVP